MRSCASFDANVIAMTTLRDQPAIVLDQTAFYPEAGGQLGDRGTLGSIEVVDTQELDDGTIVHLVASAPALEVGTQVTGELDWIRRRQHMAQHTAQHLLSGHVTRAVRAGGDRVGSARRVGVDDRCHARSDSRGRAGGRRGARERSDRR